MEYFIIAGDFNRASLKTVLLKFHQHVQCPTRGENIFDHVYSNIKHGYKASPLPHLGLSDHISLFLTPAYRPLINRVKPSVKTIQVWPEWSSGQLQDCFSHTDWTVFVEDDIDIYTSSVLFYIKCCIDNVTIMKRIHIFPNSKPWMTNNVKLLLKTRNSAFWSGDTQQYSTARMNLKKGVRKAKANYRQKIENYFSNLDPRRAWQGIRQHHWTE